MTAPYSGLMGSVKPAQARYLRERRDYWLEILLSRTRKEVEAEMANERERALILRMLEGVFANPDFAGETSLTLSCLNPGIEITGKRGFDLCFTDDKGHSLLVLVIPDALTVRFAAAEFRRRYSLFFPQRKEIKCCPSEDFSFAIAGLSHSTLERTARAVREKVLQGPEGSLSILEIDPSAGKLYGLPAPNSHLTIPEFPLLPERLIDIGARDYQLFEVTAIEGCYLRHLTDGLEEPKLVGRKEMKDALLKAAGIEKKEGQRLRDYALRRLDNLLKMALENRLMERMKDGGDENGKEEERREDDEMGEDEREEDISGKGRSGEDGREDDGNGVKNGGYYRLLCQGTEPGRVRRSLLQKYLHAEAVRRASNAAERRAVKDYRRRFPQLEGF